MRVRVGHGLGSVPLTTWLLRLNLGCGVLSGFALFLMMLVGATDVIGTNLDLLGLASMPLPAAFEFMATMMVVNVFLAMPLAQVRRSHVRVEVVVNHLPPRWRRVAEAIQHGLSAALFGLIAWFGWAAALHSVAVGEYAPGILNYAVWPARIILAFGASLMAVQCAVDVAAVFAPRLRDRLGSAKP